MSELLWIIGATAIISLISFIGVFTLSFNRKLLSKMLLVLVAFAAGSLIGVSFFDLIPESMELGGSIASLYIVIGILIFFVVERFVGWHHSHHDEDIDPSGHKHHHHPHHKPYVYTNLAAEAVHNFIDGTLIAASFIVSVPIGIAATIAVALHEIPQEIGDFAVLIHGGLEINKALLYNFLVAITAIIGGLLTFFLAGVINSLIPALLGVAAGGFLYIALADLIPEIHCEKNWKKSIIQFTFLLIGILVIYGILIALPHG